MKREKLCICSEKLTTNYLSGKTHTLRVMLQAVEAYMNGKNFQTIDYIKRQIIELYEADFRKIDASGKLSALFSLNYVQHNTY